MKSELEALDEKEKKSDFENYKNAYVIELFPMGYYQFPKDKIDIFFSILKIENAALKSQFLNMFKIVIHSINCFKCEVEKEGRLGGVLEYVGIKSYRNLYRIRKEMYKHKFFHKEIRFNGN
jgi:hypothetical protein